MPVQWHVYRPSSLPGVTFVILCKCERIGGTEMQRRRSSACDAVDLLDTHSCSAAIDRLSSGAVS